MRKIAIVAVALTLAACTDEKGTVEALTDMNLKPVKVGGYAWFSCHSGENGDTFKTRFIATNAAGKRVSGAVCSGWLKGKTVRFD